MDMATDNQTPDNHRRTIVHIDMDCYYAQVEEILNPELKGRPVGIKQRFSVVTSNYAARDFGVTKMMSVNEALRLCPQLVLVNGEDLTAYKQMSAKIFEVLLRYTPLVEKLGLDENWLDVTDLVQEKLQVLENNQQPSLLIKGHVYPPDKQLSDCSCGCARRLAMGSIIAQEIRDELYRELNLACCAGIAHNKLLAKLVGGENKPNQQTVLVATSAALFMRGLVSLKRITGIGLKTEALLIENRVKTVSDLQNCDFDALKKIFGFESACRLKEVSFGRDITAIKTTGRPKSIGLEDSCKPISMRKDVEDRFRTLLLRLVNQLSDDGRIPVTIKILVRKFDSIKKASHRESKQANILPSLFKQHSGQIMFVDGAHEKLLKIVMRLFDRLIDMTKSFNITLLGLSFSKFQERRNGSASIANFFCKKTDVEVQSITSLRSEGFSSPGDECYRRRTTASPNAMDCESPVVSDFSDFSEPEVEPSPKKTRMGIFIAKRRCLPCSDTTGDVASPSKLRVSELRLSSRDSEKSLGSTATVSDVELTACASILNDASDCDIDSNTTKNEFANLRSESINKHTEEEAGSKYTDDAAVTQQIAIRGNLANIPACPSNVDPQVFKELPVEVQNELINAWRRNSIAAASAKALNKNPAAKANTLHRYFIRNK